MKKIFSFAVVVPLLIIATAFNHHNRSRQMGPGLGNISYTGNQWFKPISSLSSTNGAPLGHSHAMMFKGYLAMILGNDSGKKGGGFGFYDMSNPMNPQAVFTKVDAQTVKIREGHGFGFFRVNSRDYVALQTIEGVQIWDWTDVMNPTLTSNLILPGVQESDYASGSWWVATQAHYLYVAGSSNGIYIVDAANPAVPIMRKKLSISQTGGFRVGPVFAMGNTMVITSIDAVGMSTLNISDPLNPTLLDTENSLATFVYSSIVNGNYIIGAGKDTRVHLWDFSDPSNMIYKGATPSLSGGGGYVNYQDGFIHAGMSNDYYKIDMRNPDSMKVVGFGRSNINDYDHDFASVLGNLVLVGNDHGTGSSFIVHDTLPDTTPPVVNRVIPAPDAVNQPLSTRVGISFSDGIEYATIDETSLIVRPLGGQPLEGTYSYQFGIINFTPKFNLDPNKVYEVYVPAGGLKDYAGNPIAQEFVSKFSTGSSFNLIGCSLKELPFVELGLNSYFEITPFNNDSANTTYTWNFGDGNTFGPSAQPFANHIYQNAGRYTVLVTIKDGNTQNTCNILHTVYEKVAGTGSANATTIITDISGTSIWNVNPDNNSLTKTNIGSLSFSKEIPTGKHPVSLAQDGEGNIWVANKEDATVQIFSNEGNLIQTIPLKKGSLPSAITISPDKQNAYVSLHGYARVAKINVASHSVEMIKEVCPFPKGLAVSRDNQSLFVTRFITEADSGEVYVLNASTLDLLKVIKIVPDLSVDSEFGGKGVSNYLNSITLSPDGRTALIQAKKDNVFRGLQRDGNPLNFENTVRATMGFINLTSRQEDVNERIDVNNGDIPSFSIYSNFGNLIFLSLQGNNRVDVFDAYRGQFLTSIEDVGDAPQGLTLSATGDTLFVHNFLSRTNSAYNISAIVNQLSTEIIKLGEIKTVQKETMNAQVLKGKLIFYNAKDERMNQDSYMSCATCHLDGDNDGRVWDLTQLGEGLRNTIPLTGRAGNKKGAVHWTGNFDEIQDFEGQIRALAGGKGFMSDAFFHLGSRSKPLGDTKAGLSEELDALAAYIGSLDKYGDSPYRDDDGSLSDAGERGKMIFANMQCGLCHSGNDFSDSEAGLFHDVGSIKPTSGTRLEKQLLGFDCPTLKGLWMSPPYLHDGSAKTLHDALACSDGVTGHADLNSLSQTEMDDLVAYLLQLDDKEVSGAPFMNLKLVEPEHHSIIQLNEPRRINIETNYEQITEVRYYINGVEFARKNNMNERVEYNFNNDGEHKLQAKVYHNGGKLASLTPETKITVLSNKCDFGVTFSPNPVGGPLKINTNGINASKLSIYDYSGKRIFHTTMQNTSEVYDFTDKPHGVYFLVVEKDDCKTVKKIVRY
jgi:cytochrome c peroxidase